MEKGINEPVLQALAAQFADPEAFIARIKHLYEHPDEKAHDELRLKDGRVIDRHTAPLRDAKAEISRSHLVLSRHHRTRARN